MMVEKSEVNSVVLGTVPVKNGGVFAFPVGVTLSWCGGVVDVLFVGDLGLL